MITTDTTLTDILDAADAAPVRIERDGVVYLIRRNVQVDGDDIWKDYDPQAVIDMLDEFARNPLDIDTEQWIADVYRWREEGSRPEDPS